MCFGRWDTPQHVLVDDSDTLDFEASEHVWPGWSTGFCVAFATGLTIVFFQAKIIVMVELGTSTL